MSKQIVMGSSKVCDLSGEFRAILYNSDGSVAHDSGWDSNRILNRGLVQYGAAITSANAWYSMCVIGSGGGATDDSMSSLESYLAEEGPTILNESGPIPTAPNYEFYSTRGYRFDPGQGTGTIREMGMSGYPNTGNLFCRHLLATPIVKSETQYLDIFYRLTVWPSLLTESGQVTIDGIIYDWESSHYNLVNNSGNDSSVFALGGAPTFNTNDYYVYPGAAAGLEDAKPVGSNLGTMAGSSGVVDDSGSGFNEWTVSYPLTLGNGVDYCRTFIHRSGAVRLNKQTQFTQIAGQPNPGEGIPKDNTEEMTMSWRYTWGRR